MPSTIPASLAHAGFSGAAGFPTWESLLRDLAARPEAENIRPQIEERLKDKTSHAFDEVAQALEDVVGRDALVEHLRGKFTYAVLDPVMERRRQLLKEIPFRAVLTTNYDRTLKGQIPEPSMYRQLLRSVRTPTALRPSNRISVIGSSSRMVTPARRAILAMASITAPQPPRG